MSLFRLLPFVLITAFARPAVAGPVEDLLRVTPPNAAFVIVVRDASHHAANLKNSPFAESLSRTPLGQRINDSPELRKLRESIAFVAAQTETPASSLLTEILGEAVVFAAHPNPGHDPLKEKGILLLRPAKPEVLDRFLERLNALQLSGGELAEVRACRHQGESYLERRKSTGSSEFYASRQGLFAFSTSEDELRSFLERVKATEKQSDFVESIAQLDVASAAVVLLLNPRALDGEMAAKVASAQPGEKAFLEWFAISWKKLDAAAIYLRLDKDAELGLSLRARPGESLLSSSMASALWSSIPDDAILAVAGKQRLSELVDSINSVLPVDGQRALRGVVEQTLAPVIGKDKMPLVVDSLGPNWAMWVESPRSEGVLPSMLFAIEVQSDGPRANESSRALVGAMQYIFQTIRVMNNARRTEQIELVEETHAGVVIRSLVGEKTFPPQIRPSFALKEGYLLLASTSEAIRRFQKPSETIASRDVQLARFSATSFRQYLRTKGPALAAYLNEKTRTPTNDIERWVGGIADSLEPFDRVELFTRTSGVTHHFALKFVTTKPLKP